MRRIIFTLFVVCFAGGALFAAQTVLNPVSDGFVRQSDDSFVSTNQNMEMSTYNTLYREIFLNFDLTSLSIDPDHAILKLYVNDVSNETPVIAGVFGAAGNVATDGTVTYSNRPTDQTYIRNNYISEDSIGKWLSFDLTYFIRSLDLSSNKLVYFRVAIVNPASGSTSPLVTIGSRNSSNKPELTLSNKPIRGVYELPYAAFSSFSTDNFTATKGLPEFAFDGSGLLPAMGCETAADYKAWRTSSGSLPHWLIVGLQDSVTIGKFHFWNLNWMSGSTDYTGRGAQSMDIYVSSSEDDMSAVSDFANDARWQKVTAEGFTLPRASGITAYAGDDVAVTKVGGTRWFALKINSIYTTGSYTGLSEVKVYAENPEPAPDITTGVNNGDIQNIFQVYSVAGVLTVSGLDPAMQVCLYNIQGQLLRNEISSTNSLHWNLPAGVYLLKAGDQVLKAIHR